MMQYSVYKRHCATRENATLHIERMGKKIPAEGEVRFIQITDRQFGDMKIFRGKKELILKKHLHNWSFSNENAPVFSIFSDF